MYKAFIIDDEPFARARLRELIDWEGNGFSIVGEASNGEDGYRDILLIKPHLVLTDIRMPVFNGLELIRRIILELPYCRFIIFSGYCDFEYAHKAIQYGVKSYLLKPVNKHELKNAVLSVKKELDMDREREYILNKSFMALREKWAADVLFRPNMADIYSRAMEIGLDIENSFYTVMIVDLEETNNSLEEENEEENSVISMLMRKVVDEVLHIHGKNFVVDDGYNRYIVLHAFHKDKKEWNWPNKLAEKLWERCNEIWKGYVTVGYSDVVGSLSSVAGCYKRARTAIEGKFVLGKNKVIGYQSTIRNTNTGSWNKLADWNRAGLDDAIQSLDCIGVKKETEKLFHFLKDLIHEPALIKGIITENLVGVLRILIKLDGDVSQVFGENFNLDDWFEKHTLDELENQFYTYCLKIMDYIAKARKNRPNKITEQMMDYIQKHYCEDISLKSIGRMFYMNPVYLGQLFKNDTGRLFHEVLTETRMKTAKKMLTETNLTIGEIAEKCGYKVIRNFYIAFKKYFQCTPKEYRNGNVETGLQEQG